MANLLTLLICTFFALGFFIITISVYMYYANNTQDSCYSNNIDNYTNKNSTQKKATLYNPKLDTSKKHHVGYKNNILTDAEKNQRKYSKSKKNSKIKRC